MKLIYIYARFNMKILMLIVCLLSNVGVVLASNYVSTQLYQQNKGTTNKANSESQDKGQITESREAIQTPKDFGYESEEDNTDRQRTEFQGKRGEDKPFSLEILVPRNHRAKTISSHPKFWLWIEPLPKKPIQYNLMHNSLSKWDGEFTPTSNLQLLKFPENLPPLFPGVYILTVSYGCPKNCYVARIAFEVVEDKVVEEKVSQVNVQETIKLLSEEGYWIDAQSYLFEFQTNQENN